MAVNRIGKKRTMSVSTIIGENDEEINEQNPLPVEAIKKEELLFLDDYTTTGKTYIGKAPVGSATGAGVWQISVLDETGNYMERKFAEGEIVYDKEWDERANYNFN